MFVKRFEDLIFWQKSRILTREIYNLSSKKQFFSDWVLYVTRFEGPQYQFQAILQKDLIAGQKKNLQDFYPCLAGLYLKFKANYILHWIRNI